MGVLLMLMTIGGLIFAAVLLAIALIGKKTWLRNFVFSGVAVWFVFYAVMLFGFSLTSTEKVLVNGEAKEYCGFYLDCHMHTVVTGLRTAKTVRDWTAKGMFYIVSVKVFSDAKNPNIALNLIEPKACVVDSAGQKYERRVEVETYWPSDGADLGAHIHNYETIEAEIVFDLPTDIQGPKLLITEGYGIDKTIEHVLVGDEDSIFHAQTFFELREQNENASVK